MADGDPAVGALGIGMPIPPPAAAAARGGGGDGGGAPVGHHYAAAGDDEEQAEANPDLEDLVDAIRQGHMDTIARILTSTPALIHELHPRYDSPLRVACCAGQVKAVEYLLDHGGSVNYVSAGGGTLLFWASFHKQAEVVRLLLARGANVILPQESGWTPLMIASCKGADEVVKVLLAYRGPSPIYAAALRASQAAAAAAGAAGAVVQEEKKTTTTRMTTRGSKKRQQQEGAEEGKGQEKKSKQQPLGHQWDDDSLAQALWTACCFGRTGVAHLLLKVGRYVGICCAVCRLPPSILGL